MGIHIKPAALVGVLSGLVVAITFLTLFLTLGSGPSFGPTSTAGASQSGTALTHEEMHRMMDAGHGPGESQGMHEAMGPEAEEMMDRCVAMMATMGEMHSMMDGGT